MIADWPETVDADSLLVAITCARDEEHNLPALIESMERQTRRPDRWVVVDDGSTDGTADVLDDAASRLSFLQVVSRSGGTGASFASKVDAFESGWAAARGDGVGFLACVDADVTLAPDYFERVLNAFEDDPRLGVSGGRYLQSVRGVMREDSAPRSQLPGGGQVFRRRVYDEIGGYQRLPFGGEDTMANVAARAAGWTTMAPVGVTVEHRRSRSEYRLAAALRTQARQGRCDHDLGTLWWFELLKIARHSADPPAVVGAAVRLGAYVWAGVRREPRHATAQSIRQLRDEQRRRLRRVGGR